MMPFPAIDFDYIDKPQRTWATRPNRLSVEGWRQA